MAFMSMACIFIYAFESFVVVGNGVSGVGVIASGLICERNCVLRSANGVACRDELCLRCGIIVVDGTALNRRIRRGMFGLRLRTLDDSELAGFTLKRFGLEFCRMVTILGFRASANDGRRCLK